MIATSRKPDEEGLTGRGPIRKRPALVLIAICLSAWTAQAGLPSLERDLRSSLASLPHAGARGGACVIDLKSHTTVFAESADEPFVPASTMKLLVMAAALRELTPQFAFETTCATDGTNLVVVGDGDPAFGDEKLHHARGETIYSDFDRWAQALSDRGLTDIPGDLIIDESIFDDERVHPSWEESDLDNWYAAPIGGLNFNDNCVDITVSPASKAGTLALLTVRPHSSLIHIVNKCRTGGKAIPILHHPYDSFEYRVSGRCARRWSFGPVSFPDPGLLFADSLRTALAAKDIRIRGTLRRTRVRGSDGSLPESLTILGRRRTPLDEVLGRAGKDSQNLFAECLLKRVGYAWATRVGLPDPQGSRSHGADAVHAMFRRAGISETGLAVADGSGLSRDNACTARQLANVLAWMHRQESGRLLFDSFSVAGVDGSLKKRLRDMPGRVHAKTGTMSHVRTLAGYVTDDTGPRYAFAVLFNGYDGPSRPYKQRQDRFCRILVHSAEAVVLRD